MSRKDGEGVSDGLDGLSKGDAVEAVLNRVDSAEPQTVRRAFDEVTNDGVVSWEAADASVAHAAKVVSTPETRIELAAFELSEAREAAEPVTDLDVVRVRLDDFEARLSALENQLEDLGRELKAVVRRCTERDGLYDVARGIQDVVDAANRVHRAADDLKLEIEDFERWLGSERVRFRELETDVSAVEDSVEELAGAVGELAEADVDGGADGLEAGQDADLGDRWFEARLQTRLLSLLIADLRAELSDLRKWAKLEGTDGEGREDQLVERLDDLDEQVDSIGDRLEAMVRQGWLERFGDRVESFGSVTDELEPLVDWGEVQAAFERHRVETGHSATQP